MIKLKTIEFELEPQPHGTPQGAPMEPMGPIQAYALNVDTHQTTNIYVLDSLGGDLDRFGFKLKGQRRIKNHIKTYEYSIDLSVLNMYLKPVFVLSFFLYCCFLFIHSFIRSFIHSLVQVLCMFPCLFIDVLMQSKCMYICVYI